MGPFDFHSIEKNTMEVKGAHQQFGYRHSSKCHLLFSRRKKLIVLE